MTSLTPWVQRTFHFDFPVGLFPVIFCRLEGTLFRLLHIVSNADDQLCGRSDQGWSVKQHIGHLYDLEELWWKRLADYQQNNHVLTAADMTNQKTETAGHNEKSLEELLSQFTAERQKLLETAYAFDEEVLTLTAEHPRLHTPMRLVDLLYFVAEHDDHHLTTISNKLRKPIG